MIIIKNIFLAFAGLVVIAILSVLFSVLIAIYQFHQGVQYNYSKSKFAINSDDSIRGIFFVLLFPKKESSVNRALLCASYELEQDFIIVENLQPEKHSRNEFTVYPPENFEYFVENLNRHFQEIEGGIFKSLEYSVKKDVVKLKITDTRLRNETYCYRVKEGIENLIEQN